MVRSYRKVAAAVVATLALAASGYAAPAKSKSHSLVGTLQKVEGQTVTVQTSKGTETVMLVSSSKIHRGAATVEAASLPSYAGQRVKISYVDNKGAKQAQNVTLPSDPKSSGTSKGTSAQK